VTGHTSSFDTAHIRWRAKFAPFEAGCFEVLCEFVRVHFYKLLERYLEGHDSLNDSDRVLSPTVQDAIGFMHGII
jgi:hypothetical protein